jgi:hypothetical protein
VAKSGLPGEHHFYIAFKTDAPGVTISKRLKEKYPDEMTVVLQHRFWDLIVSEERFEVKLTFDSIPERLVVPFASIKVFFDPSVPYGLQFDEVEHGEGADQKLPAPRIERVRAEPRAAAGEPVRMPAVPEGARPEKKPRTPRRPQADKTAGAERPAAADKAPAKQPAAKSEPTPAAGPKVVSIDAFRKK